VGPLAFSVDPMPPAGEDGTVRRRRVAVVEPVTRLQWALVWTGVLALNLPLPLLLGLTLTNRGGTGGIVTGILVYWAAGLTLGLLMPRLGEALTRGAFVVAALQPMFFLHFAAGAFGMWAWHQMRSGPPFGQPGLWAEADGLAMTLLTGQPLLLAAWVFGGGVKLLFAPAVARTGEEHDYIDPGPGLGDPT
jgi:hypothetical protein